MDQHTKITGATLKVNISGFESHDEEQGHVHVSGSAACNCTGVRLE